MDPTTNQDTNNDVTPLTEEQLKAALAEISEMNAEDAEENGAPSIAPAGEEPVAPPPSAEEEPEPEPEIIPDSRPADLTAPEPEPEPEEEPDLTMDPNGEIQYAADKPQKQNDDEELLDEKPKKKSALPLIILMIVIVGGLIGGYFILTSTSKPDNTANTNKPTGPDEPGEDTRFKADSTEAFFTKDTLPKFDAALSAQPIADAYVKNFTGLTREELNPTYTDEATSYTKLKNKEVDFIIVSAFQEDEALEATKIVSDALVFYVHKDNKVDNLKLDEIVEIYTGSTDNWISLGGSDATIVAEYTADESPLQKTFLDLVMKDETLIPAPETTDKFDENSINFVFYSFAKTTLKDAKNVKYISVDDSTLTDDTAKDGTYPLTLTYYLVTRKGEENENLDLLKKAILSDRGHKVATDAGYVINQ